jgi:cytoskeletal protein CcmA (bactofilin family)
LLSKGTYSMAIFGRDRDGKDSTHDASLVAGTATNERAAREGAMSERNTSQVAGVDAFLGKGTKITGKVVLEGTGRIEGQIDGEVSAQDTLTIGEGAAVSAKVSGTSIIIEGQVTGDVIARHRLELRASSRVQGNITTPSLVVHEGAKLEGQCSMSGADGKGLRSEPEVAATHSLDRARNSAVQVATVLTR